MQPPAEQVVGHDRKKPERRVVRPVEFDIRTAAADTRFAERRRFRPLLVALDLLDLEPGGFQRGHVLFAGRDQVIYGLMENVEIVRVAGRIFRRIQHETASKVAGLRAVAHQHAKDFFLERG